MSFANSLRFKLLVCIITVSIVPPMVIGYYYYQKQNATFEQEETQQASDDVQFLISNLEQQTTSCARLSDWTMLNKSFEQLFKLDANALKTEMVNQHRKANEALRDQMRTGYASDYVDALLLVGNNGITLQSGLDAGDIDPKEFKKQQWVTNQLEENGKIFWDDVIENPIKRSKNEYLIPVVRPIITSTGRVLGWTYIGFSTDMVADALYNFTIKKGGKIMALNGKGVLLYHSDEPKMIGKKWQYSQLLQEQLALGNNSFVDESTGFKYFFARSDFNNWVIVVEQNNERIVAQRKALIQIYFVILILSMAFTILVGALISNRLTKPLHKLIQRIQLMTKGHFEVDDTLNGSDELGILGRCVNEMSASINNLMNLVAHKEKEKLELELAVLQSNINPHFIYNTLNTIRWMAIIQNAPVIGTAVTSLGRLLRRTISNFDAQTTLGDEIDLLKDYLNLQDIRFAGKISTVFEIESESLQKSIMPPLILQPIVENAIFHGIEPKQGNGNVIIKAVEENGDLLLSVTDDGVGTDLSKLKQLFEPEIKGNAMTHIGLRNVDRRLKMQYGESYGLSITSEIMKFTCVTIRLPLVLDTNPPKLDFRAN